MPEKARMNHAYFYCMLLYTLALTVITGCVTERQAPPTISVRAGRVLPPRELLGTWTGAGGSLRFQLPPAPALVEERPGQPPTSYAMMGWDRTPAGEYRLLLVPESGPEIPVERVLRLRGTRLLETAGMSDARDDEIEQIRAYSRSERSGDE